MEFFRDQLRSNVARVRIAGRERAGELRSELVSLWSAHNKAADDTTKVDAEYLEVIATAEAETMDRTDN